MNAAWAAWKRAGRTVWANLTSLVILNLILLFASAPVVTVGPVLLAGYWWTARLVAGHDEGLPALWPAFRRLFWRGLIWSLGWTVILALAHLGVTVWGAILPAFGQAVAVIFWGYLLTYLLAMQPYLLEALAAEGRPWPDALRRSAWQVLANPLYSHLHLVILAVVAAVAARYSTWSAVFLVAALLAFQAVVAADLPWKYGEAPPRPQVREEDVI